MEVEGAVYPPPPLNMFLSQMCMYLLFGVIALMFIGDSLFKSMEFEVGVKTVEWLKTNFYAAMMLAFVLNTLAQQLVATGAFEIEIDNNIVFSKLETGKLPTMELLDNIANTYMGDASI
mmetsp:Transcript_4694/g.6649  ORF Transcript_4694/g.6649 Transcript_4694/m.6649 type:complete len:119 (-) Transcript_4694:262-618(-)